MVGCALTANFERWGVSYQVTELTNQSTVGFPERLSSPASLSHKINENTEASRIYKDSKVAAFCDLVYKLLNTF